MFQSKTGKKLKYFHPQDINEKLMWLTRFWRDPIKTRCADKYLVREYICKKGLSNILVPLIGVYNDALEIPFKSLPSQFVLKCNHGSGYNIIVLDKNTIDESSIKERLTSWLNEDFSQRFFELHYKNISRKIICEQLISTTAPVEYQFWCINGKPDSILVCRKNFDGSYDSWSFSLDWVQLFERIGEQECNEPIRPIHLSEMISYSELLSKSIPFVRVDFYESDTKLYFAELTFTPCANILQQYCQSTLDRFGKSLKLPMIRLA